MLGYGQSDKPGEPEEYSLKMISDDLASILDIIRVNKVVSLNQVKFREAAGSNEVVLCRS